MEKLEIVRSLLLLDHLVVEEGVVAVELAIVGVGVAVHVTSGPSREFGVVTSIGSIASIRSIVSWSSFISLLELPSLVSILVPVLVISRRSFSPLSFRIIVPTSATASSSARGSLLFLLFSSNFLT